MRASLSDEVVSHFRLTPVQKTALKKLGVITIRDLLYHFPTRYGDIAEARNIDSLDKGESAVIYGKINNLNTSKGFKSKIPMADGNVEDETGKIHCVWFNQPYLAKMYHSGDLVRVEGKISQRQKTGELYFSNPKIEKVERLPTGVGDSLFGEDGEKHNLYPIYPESRGITSSWIYHNLKKVFGGGILDEIKDPIPKPILDKYNLPSIKTALIWIHAPLKRDDALSARKRFAFEEIFFIQLEKQKTRMEYAERSTFAIEPDDRSVQEFVRRFPFQATEAQKNSINKILTDMARDKPMTRLLEGDVGSGKTAVAATVAYAVITSRNPAPQNKPLGLQVAYMCPTEILATQHFESFIGYFAYLGVQIGLITSSGCRKFPSKVNPKGWTDISRSQLTKWIENGEIAVVVGTHSLIQKSIQFRKLAFAIIDEQHRFGTAQRASLIRKSDSSQAPHLLSMTATPIPRTLALTMYGDLDITLLDQSPEGRKPIVTEIVLPDKRDQVYEHIRLELIAGRQAYVICPRIDEPDPDKELALYAKSVKAEAQRLKEKVFPEYEIGILHSRMKPKEKSTIMQQFKNGDTHILCATSVVEVGVNVPNATIIIIEGAERFGLAQLHQLRGRVMRSEHQSYCYAFTETSSAKSIERLRALATAKNGFELAELDLAQRGAGTLSGRKQWGMSDMTMEALKNLKMVEAAREEAKRLIEKDAELNDYPELKSHLESDGRDHHFE